MKRIEVSTEIGSLSVTYQKQKKMLVCLSGAGLLPSYENFSLILEKLPPTIGYLTIDFPNTGRSPIHDQAGKNLDNLADAVYEVLEELAISEYILCAHSLSGILACKLLNKPIKCQALVAMEPTTKKVMFADFSENPYPEMEEQMRLIEECGPEVYFKNITQAAFSSETNEEIWDLVQEKDSELERQVPEFHISVFIFCQAYREKEYRESEFWTSNTKLILGGNHHYLQWSESEKIAAIIRELSE